MTGVDQVGEGEEARLENDVDAAAEAECGGDTRGVDGPDLELQLVDLRLDPRRQVIPDLGGAVGRVDEQGGSRGGDLEHVQLLQQVELVTSDEAGLVDQIA